LISANDVRTKESEPPTLSTFAEAVSKPKSPSNPPAHKNQRSRQVISLAENFLIWSFVFPPVKIALINISHNAVL
jgi:hypothetical protein